MRMELRTIRTEVEICHGRSGREGIPVLARMIGAIDQALTRLGFPKPNPMLADE